jgi:hypothetical protein
MKRIIHKLSFLAVLMVLLSGPVMSQKGAASDHEVRAVTELNMVGQAMTALRSECGRLIGPVWTSINTVAYCSAGGSVTRITFYPRLDCARMNCNVNRPDPIGYVDFDCSNRMVKVSCVD